MNMPAPYFLLPLVVKFLSIYAFSSSCNILASFLLHKEWSYSSSLYSLPSWRIWTSFLHVLISYANALFGCHCESTQEMTTCWGVVWVKHVDYWKFYGPVKGSKARQLHQLTERLLVGVHNIVSRIFITTIPSDSPIYHSLSLFLLSIM